jgi:hypothetical protein
MIVLECLSCIRHQAFPEFYLRNALRIPEQCVRIDSKTSLTIFELVTITVKIPR